MSARATCQIMRSQGENRLGLAKLPQLLVALIITLLGCHEVLAQGTCLSETRRFTRNVDGQVLYYVEVQNKCSRTVNVRTCGKGLGCRVRDFKANDRTFIWIATEPIVRWSETTDPAPKFEGKAF